MRAGPLLRQHPRTAAVHAMSGRPVSEHEWRVVLCGVQRGLVHRHSRPVFLYPLLARLSCTVPSIHCLLGMPPRLIHAEQRQHRVHTVSGGNDAVDHRFDLLRPVCDRSLQRHSWEHSQRLRTVPCWYVRQRDRPQRLLGLPAVHVPVLPGEQFLCALPRRSRQLVARAVRLRCMQCR